MDGEGPRDGTVLLQDADRHRDLGQWAAAAAGYAAWLARHPRDWPIWVQHGHCVKEAGDPLGALASYRRAEAGLPDDADLKIQIGHALKRAGDLGGARAAYAAALEIDPASEAAWQEVSVLLVRPGAEDGAPTSAGGLRVVLDLSDLMSWFEGARAPTGIQRVQIEIAGPALRDGAPAAVRLAVFQPGRGTWRPLPREIFRRLVALSRGGTDPADPAWREAVVRARDAVEAAPDLAFAEGDWLVNPGSSWWLADYQRAVRDARARHGIRHAALLHDCGPVVVPEHSPPETAARFARWIASLGVTADLVLAVSGATAHDLARLQEACLPGLPAAPVALLPLDAAPTPAPPAAPHAGAVALAGEPYILFVATVESRKDHIFVLNAWATLLRRRGGAVPRLVLVGREGFGAGPALALLARAPAFAGRVVRLDDVPDGVLAGLLRGALFTLYNSAHEGWGLPVTEALAAGKVVVAPGHSGLLESGAGLALHFAPGSEPEFLALVERLVDDPGFRAAQEARIAAGLRLRSWRDVSDALLLRLASAAPARAAPAAPPLALVHRLGLVGRARPEPAMAWADLLREGPSWHAPEEWGCWTRPGRALLRLPLDVAEGTALRLHLALRGAEAAQRVTIRVDGDDPLALDVPAGARPVAAVEVTSAGPALEIAVEAPAAELGDGRQAGVGVVALMACRAGDVAARLDFLERLRFVWPEPA
ncbi:glycosyltransferase [Falsiroseomonas sp. CW058]|uniref:glycosyltransferase n=1 Tax=Falsiroseomonas sp. CW058 TaxID=3388664 RepID=UPI003D31B6D0